MSSANQRQDKQEDKEGKKKERKEDKPESPGEPADDHHRHEEEEIDDHDSEQDALEELEILEEMVDMLEGELHDYSDYSDYDDDHSNDSDDDGEESLMSNGEEQKPKEEMSEGKADNTTLLPWDFKSVSEAIQRFVDTFKARYGDNAPPFFVGELKDAAKKAFEPEAFEDRKLLALYLHNDHAVAHNIFPTKVLCSSQISALLRHQFVVWPWDKTLPVNRERLDAYLDAAGMRAVYEMLERVKEDKYPLLVVVGSSGGGKEKRRVPLVVISGRHDEETAMERLLIGLDHHMTAVSMERSRRDLNDQFREDDQQEEDAAKAQRAREFSKGGAEGSGRKEPPTAGEMLRRASLAALLPPEPDATASEGVVTVKARLPDGGEASRRFPAKTALSFLVHWLRSLGYDESHHKFLTSAHGDISSMDQSKSFADLGWMRREQVMVIETA